MTAARVSSPSKGLQAHAEKRDGTVETQDLIAFLALDWESGALASKLKSQQEHQGNTPEPANQQDLI